MSSELDVVLHGAASELPAARVLAQLQGLVDVIGLLEDTALRRDRRPADRSTWSFGELSLGSIHARLRPLARATDTSDALLGHLPLAVLDGFGQAERAEELPVGWSEELAVAGQRIAAPLGDGPGRGMTLTLIEDGRPVRSVEVTRKAATNLRTATDVNRTSLGSVVGTLAAVNTRRSRAGLWTDLDDRRVVLFFDPEKLDVISGNLGRRILAAGTLTRNAAGQVLSVRIDDISPWTRRDVRASESSGVARGVLAGEGPVEHLERVGGWAT